MAGVVAGLVLNIIFFKDVMIPICFVVNNCVGVKPYDQLFENQSAPDKTYTIR